MFQVCCNARNDINDVSVQGVRRNGPIASYKINFAPVPSSIESPVDVMKLVNYHVSCLMRRGEPTKTSPTKKGRKL